MNQVLTSGSQSFDRLRTTLIEDRSLRSDVEAALVVLLERLNPSDQGVRWAVGTCVEWIVACALYGAGAIALPEGHRTPGLDLQELLGTLRERFSVKSSFSPGVRTFRLTNGMGGAGAGFVEPTLFLHPSLPGIVYADPIHHPSLGREVKNTSDATTISVPVVASHGREHPECVIPLHIPENPKRGADDPGTAFAVGLLSTGRFPRLDRLFTDVAAAANPNTVVEQLGTIRRLHNEGVIDDEQMAALVAQLIPAPRQDD
jgi:hypothetical protein